MTTPPDDIQNSPQPDYEKLVRDQYPKVLLWNSFGPTDPYIVEYEEKKSSLLPLKLAWKDFYHKFCSTGSNSPQPKTGTRNVVCIGDSHTPDGHQPAKMPSPQPDFEALAEILFPPTSSFFDRKAIEKVVLVLKTLYKSRAWVKWAEAEGMVSREHLIDQGKLFNLSNQTKDAKLAATRAMRDRLLESCKKMQKIKPPHCDDSFSDDCDCINISMIWDDAKKLIAEAESNKDGEKDRFAHDLSTESKVDKSDEGGRV